MPVYEIGYPPRKSVTPPQPEEPRGMRDAVRIALAMVAAIAVSVVIGAVL